MLTLIIIIKQNMKMKKAIAFTFAFLAMSNKAVELNAESDCDLLDQDLDVTSLLNTKKLNVA